MSPEDLKPIKDLDPIDQIVDELEVDRADAEYIASLQVKCPVRGPDGEVREMTFGDLMGTEHGQEHGAETLSLAKEELQSGADIKVAMKHALGSQAIRDKETSELLTADSHSRQADTAQESKKK